MAKKELQEQPTEGPLMTAAKKIGRGAGKLASTVSVAPETSGTEALQPPTQPSLKVPKLVKKNKNRLPRKQKKAQQKAGIS